MNPWPIIGCIMCFVGGFLLGRPRRCIVAIVPRKGSSQDDEPEDVADIDVGLDGCGHARSEHMDATIVVEIR